jgi:hypothetical protein
MFRSKPFRSSVCLLLAAFALGVGWNAWADGSGANALSPSPEGAAVSFRNIEDGDTVPLTFVVKFRVSGMGMAPAGTNIENTGHHHLLIDLDTLPELDRPLPANDHIRHFGKGQTESELTLAPGQHTLQLLFADYLHTPHEPPVISEPITITVSPDAPMPDEEEDH